jgi:hypothetical protein
LWSTFSIDCKVEEVDMMIRERKNWLLMLVVFGIGDE